VWSVNPTSTANTVQYLIGDEKFKKMSDLNVIGYHISSFNDKTWKTKLPKCNHIYGYVYTKFKPKTTIQTHNYIYRKVALSTYTYMDVKIGDKAEPQNILETAEIKFLSSSAVYRVPNDIINNDFGTQIKAKYLS
jgi:hypothetical protein